MNRTDYAARASRALAMAEAESDPRDKAVWKAAARAWEQLGSRAVSPLTADGVRLQRMYTLRRALGAVRTDVPPDASYGPDVESEEPVQEVKQAAPAATSIDW